MSVEVWAAILTYLTLIALCNVSVCSKAFYVLAHKNKKFEKTFTHSKFIVSNVDMYDKYAGFCLFFIKRLQHMLEKFFDRDLILPFKKKLLSDVIFDMLLFRVYDHFFNCHRGFYVHNRCNFCTKFVVKEKKLCFFLNENFF